MEIKHRKGITITVSPEAFEIISKKALESKPRLNKRQYINKLFKLPFNG